MTHPPVFGDQRRKGSDLRRSWDDTTARDDHGTTRSYSAGCRCDPCRLARNRYEMHRRKLRGLGRPYSLDPTGTHRRLQALARLGWTYKAIATECGWSTGEAVGQLLQRSWVERATAAAVRRAYDRLSMQRGPSVKTARRAEVAGWPPPLAWDDDAIDDPDAEPYVATEPTRVGAPGLDIEDVEFMLLCGENRYGIAARLGVKPDTVYQALHRAGRADLVERLEAA